MDALLDAVADPDRRSRRPPEPGIPVTDDPEGRLLVKRHFLRLAGRFVVRVRRHIARGPVGLEIVTHPGRQIDGMRRLDAERAHVLVGERDRNVVLFGAKHRLAFVLYVDGQSIERCSIRLNNGRSGENKRSGDQSKAMRHLKVLRYALGYFSCNRSAA